ncbi:32692_t:CDS:2, partial [Gigaspora margarita]
HKLINEISLEELSQYVSEILELLTTGMPLVNKEKRYQAYDHLQKEYKFSKEQGPGLEVKEINICQVSDSTCSEETIKETAQRIVLDKLSKRD